MPSRRPSLKEADRQRELAEQLDLNGQLERGASDTRRTLKSLDSDPTKGTVADWKWRP